MTDIFLLKLCVSIATVLLLSIIAERISPRAAGVLSGYPTSTAIILFFFGLEQGPQFAAESALFTIVGISAMLIFLYVYYRVSAFIQRFKASGYAQHYKASAVMHRYGALAVLHRYKAPVMLHRFAIIISSGAAILAYFGIATLYKMLQIPLAAGLLLTIIGIALSLYGFRDIVNSRIDKGIRFSMQALLVRAIIATSIILLITESARMLGPEWSGLFSAFPTILFPLILIVHMSYGTQHAHTVIKNVPYGIGSVVLYSFIVSIMYPAYGIYIGTFLGFAASSMYVAGYLITGNIIRFLNISNKIV